MSVTIKEKIEVSPKKDDKKKSVVIKGKKEDKSMVDKLNKLLSDYFIMFQNLNGLHWLLVSPHFYQLHKQYGKLYDAYGEYIDQVAEQIRMLDGIPLHTYQDYLDKSTLPIIKDVSCCHEGLQLTMQNTIILIGEAEEYIKACEKDDPATADLLIKILGEQKKQRWMLKSTVDGFKKMMDKK